MSIPEYSYSGPLEIRASLDISKLAGRSVLVTGGGSGLGRAYSQAFSKAGAYVTVADISNKGGNQTVQELEDNAQFVQCDVTNWDQLVQAFEAAIKNSPNKGIDVVIANAGIVGQDDMFDLQDPNGPPMKPSLKIMDVNLTGVLYTAKLAMHYFRRQSLDDSHDRCLILKCSLAGYVDLPGSIQYNSSKFGVRGIMRSLRRTTWKHGIRVNLVAPWYVATPILPPDVVKYLEGMGVNFATTDDAARAMLMLASDKTINGRAIGVVPREQDEKGLIDVGLDDFAESSRYHSWQQTVLDTVGILVE